MANTNIPRPRVACEISAERVVAARAADKMAALESATSQNMPSGALAPGMHQANLAARAPIVTAVRESLEIVSARSRDVILIIPDATTRIILLDFDTLPDKPEDAEGVVRFRLKKSVPFDVDQSAVAFDRHTVGSGLRVIAAVTPRSVLDEYESAVREAGYNPGTVMPSMIAALGAVDATTEPTMVIKVESGTTTFAIVDRDQLLLYRALENGGVAVTGESLIEDVNTSLVYFEDRYNVNVERVLVSGVQSRDTLQAAFSDRAMRVEELVSPSLAGAAASNVSRFALAGVAGALVS
jgi:type IV pilus assembly protein PilM